MKRAAKKTTVKRRAPVKKAAAKKAAPKKKPATQKPAAKKKAAPKKAAPKAAPKKAAPVAAAPSAPAAVLNVGMSAPAFTARNEQGAVVSLSDFAGRNVVLYFYPKDDTPGCTQEACDFRDSFARLQSKGAVVLGVSKDSAQSHQKFKAKYQIPYSLLVDEDGQLCEKYGVWKEKSMYGRTYMGIERSTFLIGPDGKIRKVYPKVSVTGHVEQILQDL